MPNSTNTSWIVSQIKWIVDDRGRHKVTHCNSRTYRREDYARERYDAIVESIQNDGYELSDLDVPKVESYEGVLAKKKLVIEGRKRTNYVTVYLDRNPVWTPG